MGGRGMTGMTCVLSVSWPWFPCCPRPHAAHHKPFHTPSDTEADFLVSWHCPRGLWDTEKEEADTWPEGPPAFSRGALHSSVSCLDLPL